MPKDVRRAIASVEVEEEWDDADEDDEDAEPGARVVVGRVSKVKFWDKPKALELLGRHLKLFTDKIEVKADASFADVLKQARERAQRR